MKVSDEKLLELCLSGMSQREIASALNMTPPAVCKRMSKPAFKEKLREHRQAVLRDMEAELSAAAKKSVQTLVELLDSSNQYLRFSTASRIVQLNMDIVTQQDLLEEIEKMKSEQQSLTE